MSKFLRMFNITKIILSGQNLKKFEILTKFVCHSHIYCNKTKILSLIGKNERNIDYEIFCVKYFSFSELSNIQL